MSLSICAHFHGDAEFAITHTMASFCVELLQGAQLHVVVLHVMPVLLLESLHVIQKHPVESHYDPAV